MNKKSTISIICIGLVLGLCLIAFEVVKLWAYVSLGLAWATAFFTLTLQAMSRSKGEEGQSLKRRMLLGGIGWGAFVLIRASFAGFGLGAGDDPNALLAFLLVFLDGVGLLLAKIAGTICAIAAIAMTPKLRVWVLSVVAVNTAMAPLVLLFILIAAPIFLLLAIIGGLNLAFNFFLWIGFFIWLYSFYKLNTGSPTPVPIPIQRVNIFVSIKQWIINIIHTIIDIFPKPRVDQKKDTQSKKEQRRSIWALSLWGDMNKVEIIPAATPWKMSPMQYNKLCMDVDGVDSTVFEITSPKHGAGDVWHIIPEGEIEFEVLVNDEPISGKTSINAGSKIALRKKGTVEKIGQLDVKRRSLIETKTV